MKRIAILFLLVAISPVYAQSGIEIPCEGSPDAAVLTVPKPGDQFLHVLCSRFGHVLTPTAGWFWTPPGTFEPRFFPAQMLRQNPEEVGNRVYFESIRVGELTGSEASEKWALLGELFPEDKPPDKALEIVARNNSGGAHTIYLFPDSWGYSCSPSCKKTGVFLMVSQNKELPRW